MRDNEIPDLHKEKYQKEVVFQLMLIGIISENQQRISGFHYLRSSPRVLKSLLTTYSKLVQGLCHIIIRYLFTRIQKLNCKYV